MKYLILEIDFYLQRVSKNKIMAVYHFSCFSLNCMKIQKLSMSSVSKFEIIVMMFGIINYYKLQHSLMIQIEMLIIPLIKKIYNLNVECSVRSNK